MQVAKQCLAFKRLRMSESLSVFPASRHGPIQVQDLMKSIPFIAAVVVSCTLGVLATLALGGESGSGHVQAPGPGTSAPAGVQLKSFEYLGCSGDWTDEGNTPEVWRAGGKHGVYYLVRHADTCGYTIGSKPFAKLSGATLALGYTLGNENGPMAACPCEYWARFELAVEPGRLSEISVNGVKARLKGGLAER